MGAHQAPPSLGFSWQEHWSGLPFPSPKRRAQVSKKPHLFAGVLVRNWGTFPGQPCLEGARWPQETPGPSAFMLVLSLLFSGDSIHREPTLGQAGLLQALRRPCSSNGPVKWVLLSSLPLNLNHVWLHWISVALCRIFLRCARALELWRSGLAAGQHAGSVPRPGIEPTSPALARSLA